MLKGIVSLHGFFGGGRGHGRVSLMRKVRLKEKDDLLKLPLDTLSQLMYDLTVGVGAYPPLLMNGVN